MRSPHRAVIALIPLLALAACGDDSGSEPSATASATPGASAATTVAAPTASTTASAGGDATAPPSSAAAPQVTNAAAIPEALDFSASFVGGGEFDPTAYAGKPVAFWFWAPT
jgi:hypothetical protein